MLDAQKPFRAALAQLVAWHGGFALDGRRGLGRTSRKPAPHHIPAYCPAVSAARASLSAATAASTSSWLAQRSPYTFLAASMAVCRAA